jgi:hypothetical protein
MTGPQFQAKLPKVVQHDPGTYLFMLDCGYWLKNLKKDLLSRQYKE